MTVEFWIKALSNIQLDGDSRVIFTLKDNVDTFNVIRDEKQLSDFAFNLDSIEEETEQLREYMKIYFKNNTLICAPLG